jgi:stress response protein YsnF
VGPKLLAGMRRQEQNFLWAVHYILTTGANWRGPIKRFRLVIEKDAPGDKVSVCLPDTRRASPTTFEVVRTNFVPDKDLRILFIPAM